MEILEKVAENALKGANSLINSPRLRLCHF